MESAEARVLDLLGEAASAYAALPQIHPSDINEFVAAIHAAQNIVLAREGLRAYVEMHGFSMDEYKESKYAPRR